MYPQYQEVIPMAQGVRNGIEAIKFLPKGTIESHFSETPEVVIVQSRNAIGAFVTYVFGKVL